MKSSAISSVILFHPNIHRVNVALVARTFREQLITTVTATARTDNQPILPKLPAPNIFLMKSKAPVKTRFISSTMNSSPSYRGTPKATSHARMVSLSAAVAVHQWSLVPTEHPPYAVGGPT
jgi:hypothetical protein